jgi:hypothetical protein
VADRQIDQDHPSRREQHHRREPHPLDECADDQSRGNDLERKRQ